MTVNIAGREIGPGRPCLIVAEAGVNHNGETRNALRLVDAAARAEADAVKFQTFSADRIATAGAPKAAYQRKGSPRGQSMLEMLRNIELDEAAHRRLRERCRQRSILFLSTPFDEQSADLLERLGVAAFKVPSGEITNLPLLAHIARKGRPVILSTGMADLREVGDAVRAIEKAGDPPLVLLHCVSRYPAPPREANLRAMATLASAFGRPVGFSDHTPGIEVSLAAAALGACLIEKHFTLDRGLPGPDHACSLEPGELAALVRGVRIVESSLGHGRKEPVRGERETARVARKSLVAARLIPAGSRLSEELIALKRPGTGLPPAMRAKLIGRVARRDIPAGSLLRLEMLA
ncbi:MAG: N-acetylneuraminate synthase [Elusimicrobiota bacterium]